MKIKNHILQGLNRILMNLFSASDDHQGQVRQEMLIRRQSFKLQYKRWKESSLRTEVLKNLYTSFTLSKLGVAGEIPMHYFQDSSRYCLIIHYIETMDKDLLRFLQDHFKERLLKSEYTLYLSERKIFERTGYIEKSERHILKPAFSFFQTKGLNNQLFGLININIQYINDRPLYIEIITENIPGEKFSAQHEFEMLTELLFT